jgi:hypothetical protein
MSVTGVLCLLLLSIASSRPAQLEHVQDDTDVPDAAFADLIDHVRTAERDESVELRVDHAAVLGDTDRYRGMYITVAGRLEQHRRLGRPFDEVDEWFIRDESGAPWAVYVTDSDPSDVRSGRHVSVSGLLYKRLRLQDRSGVERTYPALIASTPVWLAAPVVVSDRQQHLWLLLAMLAIGLIVVMVLGRRLKRQPPSRPVFVASDDDEPMELPDEPTEALRELQRRGDSDER